MKSRLLALGRAVNNSDLYQAILQSLVNSIDDNERLQEFLHELLPFLSDSDRNLRCQAIRVLAFCNKNFRSPVVQRSIAEMAVIKLADTACSESSSEIILANMKQLAETQLSSLLPAILNVPLRVGALSSRLAVYNLLKDLVERDFPIENRSAIITQLKSFCGFEQDPRCLVIVFSLFPKLAGRLLNDLSKTDRHELFDVIGVFYPITSHKELRSPHFAALSSLPAFADDLATLITLKLKNSLPDTRPVLFDSLPVLLIHPTSNEHITGVLAGFVDALAQHFEKGSGSCKEQTLSASVKAVAKFVESQERCWVLVQAVVINEWVPEMLETIDPFRIRAISIVAWNLDHFLRFADEVFVSFAAVIEEAHVKGDIARVQSILASVVEFLKLQESALDCDNLLLNRFLSVAVSVMLTDNLNFQISALVLIREMANHFRVPVFPDLVLKLMQCIQIDPFAADCLIALSKHVDYQKVLQEEFISPFTSAFFTAEGSTNFGGPALMVSLASRLATSPVFIEPILVSAAKSRAYPELLKLIVNLPVLTDSIAQSLLDAFDDEVPRDLVFALGFRVSDDFMREQLIRGSRFQGLLLATASPSAIPPLDLENLDSVGKFWISTKLADFPEGFAVHPLGLAIRGIFHSTFTADLIPQLLEFENTFDRSLISTEGKFDLFQQRFVYDLRYKALLWQNWHNKLDNDPVNLLKLCLLCPPDFFRDNIHKFIGFFPVFLRSDFKGSLDLLIFALISIEVESMATFLKVMGEVVQVLLTGIASDSGPIRLDVCRVIHLMAMQLPAAACVSHKSKVTRVLRAVLDDPKREVRKMAALARCAWLRIDGR